MGLKKISAVLFPALGILLGAPSLPAVPVAEINLSVLNGTTGFKVNGVRGSLSPGFSDRLGASAARLGNINGDAGGYEDFFIGAADGEKPADSQAMNRGAGFVIFGNSRANLTALANGTNGFDPRLLNGTNGARFFGPAINSGFGSMVDGGGDHNGDGLPDLVAGESAPSLNAFGYVIYGDDTSNGSTAAGFGGLNDVVSSSFTGVTDINGDGVEEGAAFNTGAPVQISPVAAANAGDVDNDGIDDMLFGVSDHDVNGTNSGQVFLVFGASAAALDGLNPLGGSNGTNVLSFEGAGAGDLTGESVAGVGDINNDGFDDFAIGAPGENSNDGLVHVVFGKSRGTLSSLSSSVNSIGLAAALTGANGFTIINPPFAAVALTRMGKSVNRLGDFNGDGIDDFALTVDGLGTAVVVLGRATAFPATLDATQIMNTQAGGFIVAGGITRLGGSGDVNNDGRMDLLMNSINTNQAYVLFGTTDIPALIQEIAGLSDAPGVDLTDGGLSGGGIALRSGGYLYGKGVLLTGPDSSATGSSVAMIGDIDSDGYDDFAIGAVIGTAPTATGNPAGQAYIVYGQSFQVVGDTTAPTLSAIGASPIHVTSATVHWTTNENSTTQVEYGLTAGYGSNSSLNASLVTSHSVTLTGLASSSLYHYRVKSRDAAGNLATSGDRTFTTGLAVGPTPVISALAVGSISATGAAVSWTTSIAADGLVEYGETVGLGQSTALNASFVTSHQKILTALTPETDYFYRVRSASAGGQVATSPINTFRTAQAAAGNPLPYPNPWTARAGSPLTFSRLPPNSEVLIYTLGGALLRTLTADANGTVQWDAKDDSGNGLSSGVYLAQVKGSTSNKTFKFAIEN